MVTSWCAMCLPSLVASQNQNKGTVKNKNIQATKASKAIELVNYGEWWWTGIPSAPKTTYNHSHITCNHSAMLSPCLGATWLQDLRDTHVAKRPGMAAMGGQDSRHSWRWRWAIENINQRLVLKKKQLTVSLTRVAQPSKIARMIKRWDWMRNGHRSGSLFNVLLFLWLYFSHAFLKSRWQLILTKSQSPMQMHDPFLYPILQFVLLQAFHGH